MAFNIDTRAETVTRVIEETVITKTYSLDLTAEQLASLYCILGRIGGNPENTIRTFTDPIWNEIADRLEGPGGFGREIPTVIAENGALFAHPVVNTKAFRNLVKAIEKLG
jgi:hypothetical protein